MRNANVDGVHVEIRRSAMGPASVDPQRGFLRRLRDLGKFLGRWLDRVTEAITATLLVLIVAVTSLQVLMRYLFNAPLSWPEELALWSFLWLVMFGAAAVTKTAGNIRVDAVLGVLPTRLRVVAEWVVVAMMALILTLLGYLGVGLMRGTSMVAINLSIPYGVLYLAVPLGTGLALINLARSHVPGLGQLAIALATAFGIVLAAPVHLYLGDLLDEINPTLVGIGSLLTLISLGVPIAHALLLSAYVAFQAGGLPNVVIANHFASTMSTNFVLLAIPYFILMGAFMNAGGVTRVLIDFANVLVGHWRGGLAQVNVLTSALMGGLSGSSSADTAMTTKTLVPQMERSGYERSFACAITAASSVTANLLPPSITLLIYASLASQSVGALFMAGILPGLLLALTLMVTVWLLARSKSLNVAVAVRPAWHERGQKALRAAPALALPLVILMMLRGGAVTPTEAGAIACIYALLLGVALYRELNLRNMISAIRDTGRDTAVILFLIASSAPMAWLVIAEGIPQDLAATLGQSVTSPELLMAGLVGLMLVVGFFLEPPPAMVILVPVMLPVAKAVGIDPVHFGIVVVTTVMFGQLTPPVGGLVFITSAIADIPVFRIFWALRWIYVSMAFFLVILALVPSISLMLPDLLGFF